MDNIVFSSSRLNAVRNYYSDKLISDNNFSVESRINLIMRWGTEVSNEFKSIFNTIFRPIHSPLYLLNFIRLYIDERVNFIIESNETRLNNNDDEFSQKYDDYMLTLGKIYYSVDGTKTEKYKEICVSFMNTVDAKLKEFCLDNAQFSIPNQISDFITRAFTDMHRLDLTVAQVANGSLIVKGKRQLSAGDISLTYPEVVASGLQLSKHAGQTLDWLISYLIPRVSDLPRDLKLAAEDRDTVLDFESATKGLNLLRASQTSITNLINELSHAQPNFSQISQISRKLLDDCVDLLDVFYSLPSSIKMCKAAIAQSSRQNDHVAHKKAQLYLKLSEFFISAHLLVTTHYCGLHDNLQDVLGAWQNKELREPGWTVRVSSQISKPPIVTVKPVKEVIKAEASTTLRTQCSIIEGQLQTIIKALPSRADSIKYYDEAYLGLHHAWLSIQQLSSSIQAIASNGIDNPDSQLSVTSGLIASCQRLLEQMGVARMGLLNYEPRTTHGLCPFYPNWIRTQLQDEGFIREFNSASNWMRYPHQTLARIYDKSTLDEAEISVVFKALLASANKTQDGTHECFKRRLLKLCNAQFHLRKD